jgi:hypothetical protein
MTRLPTRDAGAARSWPARGTLGWALLTASVAAFMALPAHAAGPSPARAEQGTRWQELKPPQQTALRPLEHEWAGLDAASKQKWIALSSKFSKLTPAEQARVQERETQWAKLTPLERGQARLHFQEAKELPKEDRQARWNAYQALPPERKSELAARAAPNSSKLGATTPRLDNKQAHDLSVPRPDAGPNGAPGAVNGAPPRAIAATVVQAGPGATTTSVTRRPAPPQHQQEGMPKIAATPGYVNKATLLPQRGPQGATPRSPAGPGIERAPQK